MPRPRKFRRICEMPSVEAFGPKGALELNEEIIHMSIDEFETLRLIDLEGMTQEACAKQMNVARTTVQSIYNSARKKTAQMLVNGHNLKIEGGNIILCDDIKAGQRCGRCRKRRANLEQMENG